MKLATNNEIKLQHLLPRGEQQLSMAADRTRGTISNCVLPMESEQNRPIPETSVGNTNPEGITGTFHLPVELQMLVMECADWKQHPVMSQVCKLWRNFIKTSPVVLRNRYRPVWQVTEGFDGSPGEEQYPRPIPWLHKGTTYLRQFVPQKTPLGIDFVARKLELVESKGKKSISGSSGDYPRQVPSCRAWPDMPWGFFKDDLVTIYPGTNNADLRIANREIVTNFLCCNLEEGIEPKVFPLGPIATMASYLNFTLTLTRWERGECFRGSKKGHKWRQDVVIEFYMSREPILFFTPRNYDTDNLRLWFEARVRPCSILEDKCSTS